MSIALLSLFSICLGYLEGIGRLSSNQRMNCFRRNIALSSLKFHRKMTFYLSLSLFLYNQSDHLFLTADKQTRIYNQTKPNLHRHPLDPNSPTSTSFPTQHPPELRLRSAESPSSSRQLRSLHRAVRSSGSQRQTTCFSRKQPRLKPWLGRWSWTGWGQRSLRSRGESRPPTLLAQRN